MTEVFERFVETKRGTGCVRLSGKTVIPFAKYEVDVFQTFEAITTVSGRRVESPTLKRLDGRISDAFGDAHARLWAKRQRFQLCAEGFREALDFEFVSMAGKIAIQGDFYSIDPETVDRGEP